MRLALILILLAPCADADTSWRYSDTVDLLSLVDVRRDSIRGTWRREGRSLISPPVIDGLLQIPYRPPLEYDLEAVVEWIEGLDGMGIGLPSGKRQVLATVDSYHHRLAGLSLLDGKTADKNGTTVRRRFFEKQKPVTIKCSVRLDGIDVFLDGTRIIAWKGSSKRLSLRGPWVVPNEESIFLCSLIGTYRFTKLELNAVASPGWRLSAKEARPHGSGISPGNLYYRCACGKSRVLSAVAPVPSCCGEPMTRQ